MKRVQYIDVGGAPVVGQSALVIPFDHPTCTNPGWIRTTAVQQISPGLSGPTFRTLNTIYRPMDGIEPLPVGKVQFRDYSKTPYLLPAGIHA